MDSTFRRSHLTLAITSLLATSGLQAATITVDTLADPGDPGDCSLRQAIESINAQDNYGSNCAAPDGVDDTIVFAGDLSGTITLSEGQLDIYESMNIQGPGADVITVDADEESRVFQIDYAQATISGLTITGGSSNYGAGIYMVYDASLFLTDCVVTGNVASGYGGGIEIFGGDQLVVEDCVISDNQSGQFGGGISVTSGEAVVVNSLITGNLSDGVGGGLWVRSNQFVDDDYNEGQSLGSRRPGSNRGENGYGDNSRLEVIGSQVIGNDAEIGGGIGASPDDLEFDQLGEPLLQKILDHDRTAGPGTAGLGGGNGSDLFDTNLVVAGSTISDNQAFFGGGIGALGFVEDDFDSLIIYTNVIDIIDETVISGNFGFEAGGGIGVKYGQTSLYQSTVTENFTYGIGAGVVNIGYGLAGVLSVPDAAERWSDLRGSRGVIGGPELSGGAFFSKYSSISGNEIVEFDNENGPLQDRGVAPFNLGGGLFNAGGYSYLIATDVSDNVSLNYGGGVGSIFGAVIGAGSQFLNNTGGGLIGMYDGILVAAASRIEGNHGAPVGGLWCESLYICGAAYSSISDNEGSLAGGIGVNLDLDGIIIDSHDQPVDRGGPEGLLFIENSTVSGNAGGLFGGIGAPNVEISHSTVAFNAQDSDLYDPIVRGGNGFPNAGGVATTSNSQIFHSIISENTSTDGSADLETASADPILINYSLIRDESGFTPDAAGTGNIFNQDPLLGPLDFNGGKYTQTHALLPDSPAIDAGDPALEADDVPEYDQRGPGFDRIVDDILDMGAYEFQGAPPEPGIELSQSEIDFGEVLVGTNAVAELTVTSIGEAPLELGSLGLGFEIVIAGISVDGFSLDNDTCSNQTLPPTESCTVDVIFEPEDRDFYTASLFVPSNADDNGPETVPLSGTGVAPVLAIMPAAIDFGTVPINNTAFDSVTLTNIGDAPLEITGTDVTAPFDVSTNMGLCLASGPTVLGQNESCNLMFSFTPVAEIYYSQTVEVFSDSLGGDSTVFLEGTGDDDAPPPPPPPGDYDPPLPVPTMSRIATAVLGGGLLMLGWLGLRRRAGI